MSLARSIRAMVSDSAERIAEINQRYATPRLVMSKPVRLALLSLRVYLLVLVGLLVYKFITVLV